MVKQEAKAVEQPKAAHKTRVAQFKELPLVITADDLAADVRNSMAAASIGGRLLGGEETLQAVYDELPGAIARRLKRIMPSDFRVAKVTLKLQLDVNIPGIKMGGTVDVTLEPS